jgi:hypothetical protein
MKRLSLLLSLLLIAGTCLAQDVTMKSLLNEMTDLGRLAKRPSPAYTNSQASSYDRASKDPKTNWFANADAGQFIRVEQKVGRKEYVMAELQGPGAVMRIWSANPAGIIRFYFDGEDTPGLEAKMDELLTGKVAPFAEPFAYESSKGANLYFPIPYQKHLRITVDDSLGDGPTRLYYHVNYRTYSTRTVVETFNKEKLSDHKTLIGSVAAGLTDPSKRPMPGKLDTIKEAINLLPHTAYSVELPEGSFAVYELKVKFGGKSGVVPNSKEPWQSPFQPHMGLRNTILMGNFDDDQCINVPLGDFFGSAPGINPYKTFPMEVQKDGTMISRFVMPYKEYGGLSFSNEGNAPVSLDVEVKYAPYKFDENTYLFKAQWTADSGKTHPHRDMTFLKVTGEGVWVGSNMHVTNPRPDWWGEGDEKVYVDGETFPSTFGTGTEDYYGYAWCWPGLFERPYHSQPRVDGPGNMGHTSVNRWHIVDPIPYQKSLKFDMEMWHWADVEATYARTAYWYAKPGGTPPVSVDRVLRTPKLIEMPAPVKGAIEGEKLEIVSVSGGKAERQSGFFDLSAGEQLWWKNMAAGDKLVLKVPVSKAGTYEVFGNFCRNKDYGIHEITINGKPLDPIDFYNASINWRRVSLGTHKLPAGSFTIEVISKGRREGAADGNMFGLDYLLLNPK